PRPLLVVKLNRPAIGATATCLSSNSRLNRTCALESCGRRSTGNWATGRHDIDRDPRRNKGCGECGHKCLACCFGHSIDHMARLEHRVEARTNEYDVPSRAPPVLGAP